MTVREVSGSELTAMLLGAEPSSLAGDLLVVPTPPEPDERLAAAVERLRTIPCVVVGTGSWPDPPAGPGLDLVDMVAGDEALRAVTATVASAPRAAAALALHLRSGLWQDVGAGLVAESTLYSALQAGPEFAAWRAAVPVRRRPRGGAPSVEVERHDDTLHITLCRPEVRNALDASMRDEWLDALAVADADPGLAVVVSGRGPSFCSGGDLDEFGSFPDPVTAHGIRLTRSLGAVLARLAARTTFHLHGACYGSGIELPAFAGTVTVAPDTTIALPEVGMGLVPGAGGTVSLPRRIGRHRSAWLALTRLPITTGTALAWGLADRRAG